MSWNWIQPLFWLMRMAFWLTATVFGSGAMIFLLASFTKHEFAGHALASFAAAVALLYAKDATPVSR